MKKNETVIDLNGQDLSGSNLEGCNLSDANLKDSIITIDQAMEFDYTPLNKGCNEVGYMIFSAFGFQDNEDKVKDKIKLVFIANEDIPKKNLLNVIDKLRKQIAKAMKEEFVKNMEEEQCNDE